MLDRDGWRCVKCQRAGRLELDHILAVRFGGDKWAEDNLQALCRSCHFAKSRKEATRVDPQRDRWRDIIAQRMLLNAVT